MDRIHSPVSVFNFHNSNLSFSELKKQHQVLLQEVEGLKAKLSEESKEHETKLQETQGRLEESEITVTFLKQDIERKDGK